MSWPVIVPAATAPAPIRGTTPRRRQHEQRAGDAAQHVVPLGIADAAEVPDRPSGGGDSGQQQGAPGEQDQDSRQAPSRARAGRRSQGCSASCAPAKSIRATAGAGGVHRDQPLERAALRLR